MSQSAAIRVLIVDDHAIVRQGLVAMIENEPDMTVVVNQAMDRKPLTNIGTTTRCHLDSQSS
ncbi:hypothetical protein H6F86_10375 [Phormidium sp. FACHB-592]|uniref:Response regulatory domain-containing protein n=1 Tax=Stenomitos frigidus AS-A4 TaxID=2933935 RepID=A0ABV0KPX1_9CYAN|nr:hypothetical protein [Phormidium sp. FACHB-592]MBD2074287.1 hypothetical protein [Phormidium sp. FACHB-592]